MMDKNERKGVNNREMSFISGVSLLKKGWTVYSCESVYTCS